MSESYYYGQGEVELAEVIDGVRGDWVWIGDVSELTGSVSQETVSHKESYTGKKGEVRNFNFSPTMEWKATVHELGVDNLALFTQGTAIHTASGTATAESLGAIIVGSVVQLAHPGVSSLIITDSAGSPATIAAIHYEYDEFGEIKFLTLPSSPAPTNPLKAAYAYEKSSQVAFLNADAKYYALRYTGVNLAENGKMVRAEFYKTSAGLLETLSLISNGNELASAPVTFKTLLDTSKPANGALGQYGRIINIGQ